MKSISAVHPHFPLIERYYRSETQATLSGSSSITKLPALYKLSCNFVGERTRDYFAELIAFATITAVSAWPVFVTAVAVTRMVRGY